jgi:hypothetical protein
VFLTAYLPYFTLFLLFNSVRNCTRLVYMHSVVITKPTVTKHTHMTAILYSRNVTKQKFHAFTTLICYHKSYLDRRLSTVINPPTSHVRAYATLLLLIIGNQTLRHFPGLCWHNIHIIHEINLLFRS